MPARLTSSLDNIDEDFEKILVSKAQQGDTQAIENLIKIHQPLVFNIVLRMIPDFHEAEDLSQEIILKSVMKLSTFKGDSRFGTWLYRIAVNHVLSMKKSNTEKYHEKYIKTAALDDEELNRRFEADTMDPKDMPADQSLIVKEIMVKCMLGMLLCLNRRQRIVFILGHILGVSGKVAAEIMETSQENYRKMLSRSRNKLFNFLNDHCSLINPGKPCTCERCVPQCLRNGYVDPLKLVFNTPDAPAIREILVDTRAKLDYAMNDGWVDLYRAHPLQESPDFSKKVRAILGRSDVQSFLDTAAGA